MRTFLFLPVLGILFFACSAPGATGTISQAHTPSATSSPALIPSRTPSPPAKIPTGTPSGTPYGVKPDSVKPSGVTPSKAVPYEPDCSKVEHLEPQSPEAAAIIEQFIAVYRAEFPTEYMAFENLWAIERQDEYLLLQGAITSEERDALLVRVEDGKYKLVDSFLAVGEPLHSRYIIPEVFAERNPQAPADLLWCADVSPFVEVPPMGEFNFNPDADCSKVESIPPGSEKAREVVSVMRDFYSFQDSELGEILTIQRQGDTFAIQASYKMGSSQALPGFHILRKTGEELESIFSIGGGPGAYTRRMFIRNLYAQVLELPAELLNCLDVSYLFNSK